MNNLALIIIHVLFKTTVLSAVQYGCEVTVNPPWKLHTYVPEGSFVFMTCSVESGQDAYWLIDSYHFHRPLSKARLNGRGFYEVDSPHNNPHVIQLAINNTHNINGTSIKCIDVAEDGANDKIFQTTVVVYEINQLSVSASPDINLQSSIIFWSSLPAVEVKQIYSLSVKSSNSNTRSFQLNDTRYIFTAPQGSDPCNVYNFSVTATYDGAIYTGAGCSEPSEIYSMMLPSLPDIENIESTLNYSVEKRSSEGVSLNVHFESANYCNDYPVTGYSLEVTEPTSTSPIMSTPLKNFNAVQKLLDNQMYMFRVTATNIVGNVSTRYNKIYTTDVQNIKAVPLRHTNTFTLECTFTTGSDAKGCMVVLVSESGNMTRNLTRLNNANPAVETINTTIPLHCYNEVFVYDIESNGSLGTLAVQGVILRNFSSVVPCLQDELKRSQNANNHSFVVVVIGAAIGVVLIVIVLILIVIFRCLVMRSRNGESERIKDSQPHSTRTSAGPAPDKPPPAPFEEEEKDKKEEIMPIYDLPEKLTSKQQEHTYHILETSSPRYQFKAEDFLSGVVISQPPPNHPKPSKSHSLPSHPQPPIYHDLTDLPTTVRILTGTPDDSVDGVDSQYDLPVSEVDSKYNEPVPVYQEIPGYSSTSARVLSLPNDY